VARGSAASALILPVIFGQSPPFGGVHLTLSGLRRAAPSNPRE
jgi:hypothetical protein